MSQTVEALRRQALDALHKTTTGDDLSKWRSHNLGRKGAVGALFATIGKLPAEERAAFGQQVNALQSELLDAFEGREHLVREQALAFDLEEGEIDISLPAYPRQMGGLHPATRTHREFQTIWAEMGFQVYQSHDVEEDDFNFTLLNLPPHHPARDMQDTFYTTNPRVLLRTHTSPGQIHAMRELGEGGSKPIRVILPGMCYRQEQVTARSEIQFTQVEGLAIGRNIRMSDLKGTISEFAKRMFTSHLQNRVWKLMWNASSVMARAAESASTPAGWRSPGVAWCTLSCCEMADTIRVSGAASPLAWDRKRITCLTRDPGHSLFLGQVALLEAILAGE